MCCHDIGCTILCEKLENILPHYFSYERLKSSTRLNNYQYFGPPFKNLIQIFK